MYISIATNYKNIGLKEEDIVFVKMNHNLIDQWIDNYQFTKSYPDTKDVEHKILRSTRNLDDKDRKNIIKFAKEKKLSLGVEKTNYLITESFKKDSIVGSTNNQLKKVLSLKLMQQ